jgi:uncharacterized protein (DUF1697 family)
LTEVRTYLQSGYVIARSPLRVHQQVADLVRTMLATEFSLDVPVITRRPAEIDDVIVGNPFSARQLSAPT